MKYLVASALGCAIGPGERVRLTDAQISTRRHALAVIDEKTGEVEPTAPLTFKRGEILNIPAKPDDLSSYLRSVLEPVVRASAETKAKSEPPSGVNAGDGSGAGASGGA